MSKRYDNLKYQSRGFETSRDLTIRRLFVYWDGALSSLPSMDIDVNTVGMSKTVNRFHDKETTISESNTVTVNVSIKILAAIVVVFTQHHHTFSSISTKTGYWYVLRVGVNNPQWNTSLQSETEVGISASDYCQTCDISRIKSQNLNASRLVFAAVFAEIHWIKLLCRECRCSWRSADRRCSNYIWMKYNFIARCGSYIIGLAVPPPQPQCYEYSLRLITLEIDRPATDSH